MSLGVVMGVGRLPTAVCINLQPAMATQGVIDGCRDGVGGAPPLGEGRYGNWRPGEVDAARSVAVSAS
jgi:hypothetical protein